jgi:hypothetical protein
MRTCTKCGECKKDTCFYKRKDRKSGFFFTCKDCYSKWRKEKYIKKYDEERAYESKRNVTIPRRYQRIKTRCKKKNIELLITLEEFSSIANNPCYYCENKLGQPSKGIGLDRLDPSKGYEATNVVPCCGFCNTIKMHLLTPQEMLKIAKLIIEERHL